MGDTAATDPFKIRDHVADFDAIVATMRQRSQTSRARLRGDLGVAYGPAPSETLDIFYPARLAAAAPVHIFIHGGYWRMFSKDDFSYIADTVIAAGAIAVIPDYVLMPRQRMAVLVDQMRRATSWVAREIAERGGDPNRLSVSGHSAGAHLASWLLDRRDTIDEPRNYRLQAALLLGGIYDLEPLQQSFLQAEINLSDAEVRQWTPLAVDHDTATRYTILVGADETPPFHDQATCFHRNLTAQGCVAEHHPVPATNHMSSALSLGDPDSVAGRYLTDCICHGKTMPL